jgi:FixJ family two-component response regulator
LETNNESRKTFLIVDDIGSLTKAYERLLKIDFAEFKFRAFNFFAEAEYFINTDLDKIAIALLDGQLDDDHFGYELARQIRIADAGKKIPIFLISGDVEESAPEETRGLFDLILEKPVKGAELIAKIKEKLKI